MAKDLKKRTELLTVYVVKENNMVASQSISSNTLTSIFLLEMMLKTVIIVAKERRTLG